MSLLQNLAESKQKALRVHAGQHHHQLTGGLVGDVDKGMRIPSRYTDQVPGSSFKVPAVYLVQMSTFQNSKYFGFAVPMERRTESRRVGSLQDSEGFPRNLRRQPHCKLETKRGYFESWRAIGCGIEELQNKVQMLIKRCGPKTGDP